MRWGMFNGRADVLSVWGVLTDETPTLPETCMEEVRMKFATNLLRVNAVLFILFGICFIAGLVGALLVLGTTALARIIGFIADGSPNAIMLILFGAEVLFVALSASALKRVTD